MDFSQYSLGQIRILIQNYSREKERKSKIYTVDIKSFEERMVALRAELEIRTGKGLSFEKSMEAIRNAAKDNRFLSYGDLAAASGAQWSAVHYEINSHLWRLISYAHDHGWPMLSAVVVNKHNVCTGQMEPETLKGFIRAAHELGWEITDEIVFLREQQKRVFDWASRP